MTDPGTFDLTELNGTFNLTINGYPPGAATALANLTDVNVPGPQDGQALVFDEGTGKWVAGVNGGSALSAASLVADADLSGGTATTFDIVKPDGTVVAAAVPRAAFVGNDVAVRTGDDGGSVWTVTSSGPCTLARACQAGELVSVWAGGQVYVVQATNEAVGTGLAGAGAADRFVPLDQATIDGLGAIADDVTTLQTDVAAIDATLATADGAPVGHVLADTAPYLKVGYTGAAVHDDGAFECDTDLNFTSGVDVRVWFRTVSTPGPGSFAELLSQPVDAMVGAVDAYELAFYEDADGDPRPFAEHIRTGNTVEEDQFDGPKNSIGYGAIHGLRHTIDYTGGPAGVGVEKFWMAASTNPDVVTADGIGWRLLDTLTQDVAESVKTSYTEPFLIGLGEHESHVYIVQAYNGIDGTCLVDLHAADATSATTVTCRQGTVWTAAGTQGSIENLPTGGTGDITTDTAWAAKGDLIVATGNNAASVVTVGANDTFLVADSAQPNGVKWADASTARTALGLGGAATLAVGTTTGTVAAGDDSRLTTRARVVGAVGQQTARGHASIGSATSLIDSTINLPTTMAAGGRIMVEGAVTGTQDSGGSRTITFGVKIGSTTVLTLAGSWNASASAVVHRFEASIRLASTSSQTAAGTQVGRVSSAAVGSASEDVTTTKALDVTVQSSSTAATQSFQLEHLTVTYIPPA